MNKFDFKKLVPHLIAVSIFLLVALIFCKPALDSDKVLNQGDNIGWQGMSHQSYQHKEKYGNVPLWTTNMFGGMPGYQIAMEGSWSPLSIVDKSLQLGLPQPINFFFLACISFYFLCICLRIRPYAAILGALAFAYCSYSPIIIGAGHNTKMLAMAYAPFVIGSAILIFDKKYFTGFTLLTLFLALQIGQGHQQITYYLFLILAAMVISFMIRLIKSKEALHLSKSIGLMIAATLIGIGTNALILYTSYDYSKESKRGGQLVLDKKQNGIDAIKDNKTVGLSKDYAFSWSYGIAETWSLMFPGVKGYGIHVKQQDNETHIFPKLSEKSNTAKFFEDRFNASEETSQNAALQQSTSIYWGDQPFTDGPVYLGAGICFLFILGMFLLDNKHKWWVLSVSVFGILLSWGNNFPSFNYFMFDHFPFYNKFRAPTMALVIPQIVFPIITSLTLDKILRDKKAEDLRKIKLAGIATSFIFAAIFIFYLSSDFSNENKKRTQKFKQLIASNDPGIKKSLDLNPEYRPKNDNNIYEKTLVDMANDASRGKMAINQIEIEKNASDLVNAIRKDRAGFLLSDIFKSLFIVIGLIGLILLYYKQYINKSILLVGTIFISITELLYFGNKYLNEFNYTSKESFESEQFPIGNGDRMILADTDPNFRVLNTSSLEESKTSFHHKSIGGYHPAKLGIYDDLVTYQLSGNMNEGVLNMLNTKYFLIDKQGNNEAQKNPNALGNAWFVNELVFVKNPAEEMTALNHFNPTDTAYVNPSEITYVEEKFKPVVGNYSPKDSSASIMMTAFDNDAITYKSKSRANHIAVFSEIYYKDWKAYIDGKPVDHFKANYVLRALNIPSGEHTIEFKFEPKSFYLGDKIGRICSWITALLVLGLLSRLIMSEIKRWQKNKS